MASNVYFNSIKDTTGATFHNVVQISYATMTPNGASNYTFPISNFASLPSSSGGVELLRTTFQPKFS